MGGQGSIPLECPATLLAVHSHVDTVSLTKMSTHRGFLVERFLAGIAGLSLFLFFILNSYTLFLAGIALGMLLTILQWRKKGVPGAKVLPEPGQA